MSAHFAAERSAVRLVEFQNERAIERRIRQSADRRASTQAAATGVISRISVRTSPNPEARSDAAMRSAAARVSSAVAPRRLGWTVSAMTPPGFMTWRRAPRTETGSFQNM